MLQFLRNAVNAGTLQPEAREEALMTAAPDTFARHPAIAIPSNGAADDHFSLPIPADSGEARTN